MDAAVSAAWRSAASRNRSFATLSALSSWSHHTKGQLLGGRWLSSSGAGARRHYLQLLSAIAGLVCLAAFGVLVRMDWTGAAPTWDVDIAASIQGWSFPGMLPFMLAVSWPGWSPQSWILVLAICGVLYWRGLKLAAPL